MRTSSSCRKQMGFTLIELLTALMVMSVVARIGVPGYREVWVRAEAARAAGDFHLVRQAAMEYLTQHNQWPRDFGTGQVPPGLEVYLPEGYSFNRGFYRLDWENWPLPQGLPSQPDVRRVLGLTVVTQEPGLGAALRELLGPSAPNFHLAGHYTFILETQSPGPKSP